MNKEKYNEAIVSDIKELVDVINHMLLVKAESLSHIDVKFYKDLAELTAYHISTSHPKVIRSSPIGILKVLSGMAFIGAVILESCLPPSKIKSKL